MTTNSDEKFAKLNDELIKMKKELDKVSKPPRLLLQNLLGVEKDTAHNITRAIQASVLVRAAVFGLGWNLSNYNRTVLESKKGVERHDTIISSWVSSGNVVKKDE